MTNSSVRELLLGQRHGVLATLAASRQGWPFASVAPYALSDKGEPLLLLSDLAEHSRNIRADARASLLVQEHGSAADDDPQASARVTLLGTVEALAAGDMAAAHKSYLERHPQAADYFQMADFKLYKLRVSAARFVGGFGDMGWIEGSALALS
jgi:putative heme iron utilization protein